MDVGQPFLDRIILVMEHIQGLMVSNPYAKYEIDSSRNMDMHDLPLIHHPCNPKFPFVWVAPVCMAGSATEDTVK